MKSLVFTLGLVSTLAFVPASYANPISFSVTNGTFQSGGTFSGSYTLDPVLDEITGGQFTLTDFGQTFIENFNHAFPFGPPGNDTQGIFVGAGGIFYFDTSNSVTSPVLCTGANYLTCGGGDSTQLDFGGLSNFDFATGATITPSVSPEPSSLILLATGAFGVAAVARRRSLRS
jgi:PEP-CTERM motif